MTCSLFNTIDFTQSLRQHTFVNSDEDKQRIIEAKQIQPFTEIKQMTSECLLYKG